MSEQNRSTGGEQPLARPGSGPDEPEGVDSTPENGPTGNEDPTREIAAEDPTREIVAGGAPAEDSSGEDGERAGAEVAELDEFRRRIRIKDRHVRELYDELTAARLAVDEAHAKVEAGELLMRDLQEERARLKERLRGFEEEERRRRRRREGRDRRVARLEREIERREEGIRRLEDLLEGRDREVEAYDEEVQSVVSRKDAALEEALRRVEGLERDLEEREETVANLRATIDRMQAELDLEYELRRRMADPANRLRTGIDLFNDSEHLQEVGSISMSRDQPEVHVAPGKEGDEPPVILTFTWRDGTWRTYAANPGLAVEEPRVYQMSSGEDLSGVDREPSNAHIGPGGRVILGL